MKSEIRILSIDEDWDAMTTGGATARVFASFEHVVNAVCEIDDALKDVPLGGDCYYRSSDGTVCRDVYLWVGCRDCSPGPGGLILDCAPLPNEIRLARSIAFERDRDGLCALLFGGGPGGLSAVVKLTPHSEAAVHKRRSIRVEIDGVGLRKSCAKAQYCLEAYGNTGSPYLRANDAAALRKRLISGGEHLCRLLAAQGCDAVALRQDLARIVGLGPGLTPSADDFVVGAYAVAYALFGGKSDYSATLQTALVEAADKTTDVSKMYMRSAAYGGFSDAVLDALDELLDIRMYGHEGAASSCPRSVSRLLLHGSTSGTDTLAGMACMLKHASGLAAQAR